MLLIESCINQQKVGSIAWNRRGYQGGLCMGGYG
jgi:hypothetical protein